jgi:glycosyltransferase involved in cell wall biosynthesis
MRIAFLGNMNNMCYMYAKAFKQRGWIVTLYLDAEKSFLLDRPESWEENDVILDYSWIREPFYKERTYLYRLAFPKLLLHKLLKELDSYDVVFLNGKWFALGAYLKDSTNVFGLFAGYDLDVLGDEATIGKFVCDFYSSRFKIIKGLFPRSLVRRFYTKYIRNHINGIKRTVVVSYYAEGISKKGDGLLHKIKAGQIYSRLQVRGFDCSRFPYSPKEKSDEFVILNTTRFYFLEDREDNKRNDIMLRGIAEFISRIKKKNVRLLFFEKGIDLPAAKKMCAELGLEKFIEWSGEVSLAKLTEYYRTCDVAFDQLGKQWIGSGLYSMLTGRPLIANARADVFENFTGVAGIPVCHAETSGEVCDWLLRLYADPDLAIAIGIKSREYVLEMYDLDKTIDFFIDNMNLRLN